MLSLAIHFNYVKCSGIPGATVEPHHQVSSTAVSPIGSTDCQQTPNPHWTRAANSFTEPRCITQSGTLSIGTNSMTAVHS